MAKTIYSKVEFEDITSRMKKLQADQKPLWGSLNPTEMLYHCNMANQAILESPKADKSPRLKQQLYKFIFFHVQKDFPKGARGAKRFDVKGRVDEKSFEDEKTRFFYLLNKFRNLDHKLEAAHPIFGALSHSYWGKFVWKHLDHHLKQFGL